MSPDAAEKFVALALKQTCEWNELLFELQDPCSEAEFKELKHIVGSVLGGYFFELFPPVHAQHPSIIPPELEIG